MSIRVIRKMGLAAIATLACVGYSQSASAQYGYSGTSLHHHHQHGCAPRPVNPGIGYYPPAYRPIVVYPN
jgi:hypothetical protein